MPVRSIVPILLVLSAVPATAQVKAPAPPAKYHVDLRYKLSTELNQRVRDYREIAATLSKLGFVPDERDDADLDQFDPTAERLSGTIPGGEANKLLEIGAIKTSILRNSETPLPDDARKPVTIRALIPSGLDLAEQKLFHTQVVAQLERIGFKEYVAYDHARYSVIRGALPSGKVLDLLRDLRDLPSGWFFSEIPRDQLNLPLRDILPIRQVEVFKEVDLGPVVPPVAPLPEAIASPKYSLDLAAALSDPAVAARPIRVEVIVNRVLPEGARELRDLLRMKVPGTVLEGVFGNFVVVRAPNAGNLATIASLPSVLTIRLPRLAANEPGEESNVAAVESAIKSGNLTALHAAGYRGAGSRIVVMATDFEGTLPKGVKLLDLTAELSPTVEPSPRSAGSRGSETARAAHAAAPLAEITLVRLDPIAVHQLVTVARAVLGETTASIAMVSRGDELLAETERLNIRRELVQEEYRKAFSDLSDDEKPTKRREAAAAAYRALQADETIFKGKQDRLTELRQLLAYLRGANVIVNTIVWEDGYAHDGLSEISKLLESRLVSNPTRSGLQADRRPAFPVWVQAASTMTGSVWSGPFVDADENGVMEFGQTKLPGSWTPELNFLTVIGPDGKTTDQLPAGAKIRISVQWREPRDSDKELAPEAFFPFKLKLLRQIDPAGATESSDILALVAQSIGAPTRIQRSFTAAVFEQTLEIAIPVAGRYALRVEGKLASHTLAATNRSVFELRPRIFATFASPASGRLGFATYAPVESGVAIPGDSTAALTVGVNGGLTGAGPGILLGRKPDVFVLGLRAPGQATGFVAGAAACLAEAGVQSTWSLRILTPKRGGELKISEDWIRSLPTKVAGGR